MNTEMQNHIEKVQNDHKKMQNNHDETENNYLWMQNYYKEIQKDHRVWLKTIKRTHKMPTKRRWTTTETQNDDKQCILFPFGVGWHPPMYSKKGGGVVYMSVPSSPLCHNPWLQQRQRGNQRWRCRNTYRRNSLKKARWILYMSWLTYKQTGWNSFKTCLPRGRTSSSYPVTPPFFLGVLVGVSYVAHQQELVQGKSSGTARQSWLAPGTDV